MNDKLIVKLVKKLDLGVIKEEPIRVTGGLLNRMYKVNTANGIYAIKHLNPKVIERKNARENHILAEKIANFAKEARRYNIDRPIFRYITLHKIKVSVRFLNQKFN